MKKKLFTFTIALFTILSFSTFSSKAQPAGGSAGGGVAPSVTMLTFDFGAPGVVYLPSTSPYFSVITTMLTSLHATISPSGDVTFASYTTYTGCLLPLYYTGCINNKTYTSCKTQTAPPCVQRVTTCGS